LINDIDNLNREGVRTERQQQQQQYQHEKLNQLTTKP
jgi:hypothetical protein